PRRRRGARLRRRYGQRGADLPRRPDALRRRQGIRQHEGRPGLHDPRDDRGAARGPAGLTKARRFPFRRFGDPTPVIGVSIRFIVVGIVFLLLIPWVGIAAGIVGLMLALLWVAGFGRHSVEREACPDRHRV